MIFFSFFKSDTKRKQRFSLSRSLCLFSYISNTNTTVGRTDQNWPEEDVDKDLQQAIHSATVSLLSLSLLFYIKKIIVKLLCTVLHNVDEVSCCYR